MLTLNSNLGILNVFGLCPFRPFLTGTHKHETNFDDRKSKMMAAIQTGRSGIQSEILKLRQKLYLAKETISKFKNEIEKVEGDSTASESASLTA